MEARYAEVTLGEPICSKLRDIYFNGIAWPDCHRQVADRLTGLKAIARTFYVDRDDCGILRELIRYSDDDIREIFDHGLGK